MSGESFGNKCVGGISMKTMISIGALFVTIIITASGVFTGYVDAQLEPIKNVAKQNQVELEDRKRSVFQTEQQVKDIKLRLDRIENKLDRLIERH